MASVFASFNSRHRDANHIKSATQRMVMSHEGVVDIATARHRRRFSESNSSDEISFSSDESLSTDGGHLLVKPYMHEPPATPSTL